MPGPRWVVLGESFLAISFVFAFSGGCAALLDIDFDRVAAAPSREGGPAEDGAVGADPDSSPSDDPVVCTEAPSKTCYEDDDGDTYGNAAVSRTFCGACPEGWAAQAGDCKDTDPDVHPGQTFLAPVPRRNLDFNCDNVTNKRLRNGGSILAFPAKVTVGCPGVLVGCSDAWSAPAGLPICGGAMNRCKEPLQGATCIDDPAFPIYTVECQ